MTRIEHLLSIVKNGDLESIEANRDCVTEQDLGTLAESYWSLQTWEQKCGLVNLVQDHIAPQTRDIMFDYLRAPDDESGDYIELTKAIALCHLDENLDHFMTYYNDRQFLAQTVRRYLSEQEWAQQPAKPPNVDRLRKVSNSLLALGLTSFVIAPALLLYAYFSQATIGEYRRNGITVEAGVVEKWQEHGTSTSYCVKVTFFTKPILEGGELFVPTICEFVSGSMWTSLQRGNRIKVTYLPEDPEDGVILSASMESGNLAPAHEYTIGLITLVVGVSLVGFRQVLLSASQPCSAHC